MDHNQGKIKPQTREFNLNSDKKRNWFSELKSLNDKTKCDSAAIPADIVADLISDGEIDWFDDENYEPESELRIKLLYLHLINIIQWKKKNR